MNPYTSNIKEHKKDVGWLHRLNPFPPLWESQVLHDCKMPYKNVKGSVKALMCMGT